MPICHVLCPMALFVLYSKALFMGLPMGNVSNGVWHGTCHRASRGKPRVRKAPMAHIVGLRGFLPWYDAW